MTTSKDRGPWIQTVGGTPFYPLDPRPDEVDIRTIAYVLSGEYRFGGHCWPRITVAQHSVMVADCVPEEHALWGLLHDASEAYVRDLNRPIKRELPAYKKIEEGIQKAIAERFGLPWPMPSLIHDVDNRVGITEAMYCMRPLCRGFHFDNAEPYDTLYITPWPTHEAEERFLHRFAELYLIHSNRHDVVYEGVAH